MPKVGDKEFAYTPEGIAAAKQESAESNIPVSDGATRNVTKYAGGGETGFNRIGINPMTNINQGSNIGSNIEGYNPGGGDRFNLDPDVMDAAEAYYEKGGRVVESAFERNQAARKVAKERRQKAIAARKETRIAKRKSRKMKNIQWRKGKGVEVTSTVKKLEDVKKLDPSGRIRPGSTVKKIKVTKGGAYPTYAKKTVAAKSFSEKFKSERKKQGAGKTFTWDGRSYSTNTADDLKKSKKPAKK